MLDVLAPERERSVLVRGLGQVVLDEVAQFRVLLLADRLLQRDGMLRHAEDLPHLPGRNLELGGNFVRTRLAPEPLDQLALDVHDLVQLLDHVHGNPDRPRLVGDRARHRLANPPGRVRRELVALAIVEFLYGANQAEGAFLDQVEEAQAAAQVGLGDRDDETEVRLDHLRLRGHVAAFDPLREIDLLVGGQKRHLPDLAQVEPQRVERRLDGQVKLWCLDLLLGEIRLLVRRVFVRFALDELDAVVDQIGVEVFDLLLAELDIVEARSDLVVVQDSLLEPFLNKLLEFLDVRERDFDGEHRPRLSRAGWTGGLPTQTREGPVTQPPRLTRARRGCYRGSPHFGRNFYRLVASSPTSSPRLFRTGTRAKPSSSSNPSRWRKDASAGRRAR